MNRLHVCSIVLISLLLICGCQPRDPRAKNLVRGQGQILLDGAPLAGATVAFRAVPENAFPYSSIGVTDEKGEFTVRTFLPNDGIHPGQYRAMVIAQVQINALSAEEIDRREAAGLPIPNAVFRSLIPERYSDPDTSGIVVDIPDRGDRNIVINLQSE